MLPRKVFLCLSMLKIKSWEKDIHLCKRSGLWAYNEFWDIWDDGSKSNLIIFTHDHVLRADENKLYTLLSLLRYQSRIA